ncbi:MAG: mechanosensitive ion channel family protein [Steroidobacteraceae bacterium]
MKTLVPVLLVLLAVFPGGSGVLAADPEPVTAQESVNIHAVPVMLDGNELFRVRGVSAYPAEKRARDIGARLEALARDPKFDPQRITLVEHPTGIYVVADQTRILSVFDADARLEDVHPKTLALSIANAIRHAIADYRLERTPEYLKRQAWQAAGLTVGFLLLVLLLRRFARQLNAVEQRYATRIRSVGVQSLELVQARWIQTGLHGLARGLRGTVLFVLVCLYLYWMLSLFPWTRGVATRSWGYVREPLASMGQGLVAFLPNAFFLVLLFLGVRYLLKVLKLFATAVEQGTVKWRTFDTEWAMPTYRLIRVGVIALTIVIAYPYLPGSNTAAFQGVSIFLGVLFSLGATSMIANLVAGYTMTYRRAFRAGDLIRVDDAFGTVSEVRLLVTHLRSPKNEEIIIPNSEILSSQILNYSTLAKQGGLILHTTVGIGYEVPWRQVEAMLCMAAKRTPGLKEEPAPFVRQLSLDDFCVKYEINVYCDDVRNMMALYTELHRNILDVFNEYGVQIMTPAYEGDPELPKVVPKESWHVSPAQATSHSKG